MQALRDLKDQWDPRGQRAMQDLRDPRDRQALMVSSASMEMALQGR
jgi:hypothetical protein